MNTRKSTLSALLLYGLIADAALETFWSGSPVRWWVVGAVALYAAASALAWKRPTWRARSATSLLVLMAIVALTAWLPGGLTSGVRVVGLSTAPVLSLTCAAGIALATFTLIRQPRIPRRARWIVIALGTYGVAAFLQGAVTGTPFPALLAGQSLWRGLPSVLQGAVIGGLVVLPVALVVSAVRAGLRAPVPGSTARTIRQAAALATTFAMVLAALPQSDGLVVSSSPTAASTQTAASSAPVSPERLAALENSFRAIEDGLRESPRDRWDPGFVVEHVGTDPQRLFEWVRDNTSWIPYQGVLRGPVGVLNDRLGSSLDRALLLGTLLQKAGHSIRLAHGELTIERAHAMLADLVGYRRVASLTEATRFGEAQIDVRPAAAQYQLDADALEDTLEAQANEYDRIATQLEDRVAEQSERLLSLIDRPSPEGARLQALDRAASALRRHWWVQQQAGTDWFDFDLLGPSAADGPPLATASATFEIPAIPATLYHEIAVRVIVEKWSAGGVLTEHRALEHVLRSSDLIGRSIVLRLWPNQWPGNIDAVAATRHQAGRVAALEVRDWTAALFVNRDVVAQATIRADGDVPAPTRGGPMAGLGSALSRALTRDDPPVTGSQLTSAWFEYEFRSPGEPHRVIRRSLFDALGEDRRASPPADLVLDDAQKVARSLSLMMETEILPIACEFAPEFLLHLAGQGLLANRAVLRLAAHRDSIDDSVINEKFIRSLERPLTPLYSLATARLAWSRRHDQIYIDRSGLLTRHVFLRLVKDAIVWRDATDIVANDIGVDLLAEDPFAIRLEQGVLDTNAEALLARAIVVGNTGTAFAASTEWTKLASDDNRLAGLSLPENARRRIAQDLSSGHIVVAPTLPIEFGNERYVGWWRIEKDSGHTLGLDENGWGTSVSEYAALFVWTAASELVVCSAMHEFVAVARDGASWGQGTWHGLGTCVAAAAAAGVLATLFLVVMTVAPRLFFRWWRGPGAFPKAGPKLPGRGGTGRGGTGQGGTGRGGPTPGEPGGGGPGAGGGSPSGPGQPPVPPPPSPPKGPYTPGRELAEEILRDLKANPSTPPTFPSWGQFSEIVGERGAQALLKADQAATKAYNSAINSGFSDASAHQVSKDAWIDAWNQYKPWYPGAPYRPGAGGTTDLGTTQPNPGASQPGLGTTQRRAPAPEYGRVRYGSSLNVPDTVPCPVAPCKSPMANSSAGITGLSNALSGSR